ncbi:zinc finger bed domain-containing protein 4-like, partial [Nannochloropsis oceanica]
SGRRKMFGIASHTRCICKV